MKLQKIYPVILVLFAFSWVPSGAQETELITPRLGASYMKLSDGTKTINISLLARVDGERVRLANTDVQVFALSESGKISLGNVRTDQVGKATLNLSPDKLIPKDESGYYTFEILYPGNDQFNEASSEILVMDAFLEISFSEVDSVKTVQAQIYIIDDSGEKVIIPDVFVEFYIKRIFSLYSFGQEVTNEAGICSVAFPKKMPGDTSGVLTVVVKIVDDDVLGSIETREEINWGTPLVISLKPSRGLGDTDAPLWMVYTLITLLSGVWINVLIVIGLIIRINILGKRKMKAEPDTLH
ncbi:MAG: hypothetical protein ISR57_01330 [Bacteroidales bacterium]|nr:hypothetical protein [Bacteroidales bacterium]